MTFRWETPPWQVSVRRVLNEDPVGAGVLCTPRHVLTCAHVITSDAPEKAPQTPVFVEFRFTDRHEPLAAVVVADAWVPEREENTGDFAVFELVDPPPDQAQPAPLGDPHAEIWEHDFRAYGYPRGHQRGGVWSRGAIIGHAEREWLQLQVASDGYALEFGFSGAPVWDRVASAVAGIVVTRDRSRGSEGNPRTAYAIPMAVVAQHWPDLGALGTWRLDRDLAWLTSQPPTRITPGAELQLYVAEDDVELLRLRHRASRAPSVPHMLPADKALVGRDDELALLRDVTRAARPTIVVVSGKPGVGKTALAIRLAHSLKGDFSDGELYVDLRGLRPERVIAEDAFQLIGRALGITVEKTTESSSDYPELVRGATSEKDLITVLDNADDVAQVRSLVRLGRGPTIITSRRPLPSLASSSLGVMRLEPLRSAAARELLSELIGAERADSDQESLATVAELCGGLPLALTIGGYRLRARPDRPVSFLARRLSNERRRLSELEVDDLEVRASFRLSFEELDDEERLLFVTLGVHPGPSFSLACAAALMRADPELLVDDLEALVDAQLVEDRPRPDPRLLDFAPAFDLHELLRLFARELGDEASWTAARDDAENRLFQWYAEQAEITNEFISLGNGGRLLVAENQGEVRGADVRAEYPMAWFESERNSLMNVMRLAHQCGRWSVVTRVAEAQRIFQLDPMEDDSPER